MAYECSRVFAEPCATYDSPEIMACIARWDDLFSQYLHPGQCVILKPNWINSAHKYRPDEWQSLITHPSVITGVLDSVLRFLQGKGRVVITDAPATSCSWRALMDRMRPDQWVEMGKRHGIQVDIVDLRDDEWTVSHDVALQRRRLPGDPLGSTQCDLGQFSEFNTQQQGSRRYYGADYDINETNLTHSNGHHKYKLSRSVISADVFINLPKLKTHKKAGITSSLKNLVGINTYKNWLPHYSVGTPEQGGDEFQHNSMKNRWEGALARRIKHLLSTQPRAGRYLLPAITLVRMFFGDTRRVIRSGNWHGNDTIWRMILDLNKALLYCNPDGSIRHDIPQTRKPYISIVDAITAGEGDGPLSPDPKHTGLLIAGANPVSVDAFCAKLMGFDWMKIPAIKNAFAIRHYPIADFNYEDIHVVSSDRQLNGRLLDIPAQIGCRFKPHFAWVGHIESDPAATGAPSRPPIPGHAERSTFPNYMPGDK
ncbi:MAG: DUF362 domain-containing protein [Acidobacteriia bacterium]|nr:DUF362 domain-containing protein [Terriglobia bacterium]